MSKNIVIKVGSKQDQKIPSDNTKLMESQFTQIYDVETQEIKESQSIVYDRRELASEHCCGLMAIILVSACIGLPLPLSEIILTSNHYDEIICKHETLVSLPTWLITFGVMSICMIVISDAVAYYRMLKGTELKWNLTYCIIVGLFCALLTFELFWLIVGTFDFFNNYRAIEPYEIWVVFVMTIGFSYLVVLFGVIMWILFLLQEKYC